jgi:polysaccharide pyruvyl transferase WcaK-like protein
MKRIGLKSKVFYEVQKAQARLSNLAGARRDATADQRSALFIPPADTLGGLGDDAMLSASMNYLLAHGFHKIGVVCFDPKAEWGQLEVVNELIQTSTRTDRLNLVASLSRYTHLFCVGADVMDGFYSDHTTLKRLQIIELAARAGIDTTILGFSWNENPTSITTRAMAELPENVRICARDIFSYKRLTQRLPRPIELVTDTAFLLEPEYDSTLVRQVSGWIQTQRTNGRTIIGVNLNNLFVADGKALQPSDLIRCFIAALTELFDQDPSLSFLLMPHDSRGEVSDLSLAQDLLKALPPALQPYCHQVSFPCRAAEIKAICAELDFVLTGRMHLAIACLGQTTPVGCITYQGKFEGLFQHFHIEGVTISPEQAFQPGVLSHFLSNLLTRRHQLRQQIRAALPVVLQLSAANFTGVLPVERESAELSATSIL